MSITFDVDRVRAASHRAPERPVRHALEFIAGGRKIHALGGYDGAVLQTDCHPFAGAVHKAFAEHRPLVLSPDAVWLTIGQGFAQHVNRDPEAMRGRLVDHQGSCGIPCETDQLQSEQDWARVVGSLADTVRGEVPELGTWLRNDFTTSTEATRIAGDVVLLDAVRHYFHYEMTLICGIPQVTLLGTAEDWRKIEARVEKLASYGLGWWSKLLLPVCTELRHSAEGRPDMDFWESVYMPQEIYGGELVTGWLVRFFPYLLAPQRGSAAGASTDHFRPRRLACASERNSGLAPWTGRHAWPPGGASSQREPSSGHRPWLCDGVALASLPPGFSAAPVRLYDPDGASLGSIQLLSGFFGVSQDKSLRVEAQIGWAVVDGLEPLVQVRGD